MIPLTVMLLAAVVPANAPEPGGPAWAGVWTYNVCHEDRKKDHEAEGYCRQSDERIEVEFLPSTLR